jgi:hypothetical protein
MEKRALASLTRASEIDVTSVESEIVLQGASALVLHYELGVL